MTRPNEVAWDFEPFAWDFEPFEWDFEPFEWDFEPPECLWNDDDIAALADGLCVALAVLAELLTNV